MCLKNILSPHPVVEILGMVAVQMVKTHQMDLMRQVVQVMHTVVIVTQWLKFSDFSLFKGADPNDLATVRFLRTEEINHLRVH